MKELTSLNTKKESKKIAASTLFLCALVILISGICLAVTAALILLPKSIRKLEYTNHSEEI